MDIKIKPIKVFGKPDGDTLRIYVKQLQVGSDFADFKWNISADIIGEIPNPDYENIPAEIENPKYTGEKGSSEKQIIPNPAYANRPPRTIQGVSGSELVAEGEIFLDVIGWGADDNYIINQVISNLSLTKA